MTKSKAVRAAEARVRQAQEEEARRNISVPEEPIVDRPGLGMRSRAEALRIMATMHGDDKLPAGFKYTGPTPVTIHAPRHMNPRPQVLKKKRPVQETPLQNASYTGMGQPELDSSSFPQASNQLPYSNHPTPQPLNQPQFFNPYSQASSGPQYCPPPPYIPINQPNYNAHSNSQPQLFSPPLPQPQIINQPVFRNPSPLADRMSSPPPGPKRERRAATPTPGSGGIPEPTLEYLQRSLLPTPPLTDAQHLLVIIDLNGTLLHRPSRTQPTKFIARPHTQRFLNYCIDTFSVVIWSSAKPDNVRHMCNNILTPAMSKKVIAIWGRDKFGLTPGDYNAYTQCYKRLTKVWADPKIAASHPEAPWGKRWDQTNTVLIDDDNYKGRSEPYNLIEIPAFVGKMENEKADILPQVHDYLNKLSLHDNVSAYLRSNPWKAMSAPEGPPGHLRMEGR